MSTRDLVAYVEALAAGGCTLLQYRNKSGNARVMLEQARDLRQLRGRGRPRHNAADHERPRRSCAWRPSSTACTWDRTILSPESVREIIGPDRWLGVSTHNPEQLREADLTSADYLAIGPVFATSSKEKPDPVVGLEGVRRARALTRKPLVAIGGITRANAASVIEAGADSVAVISDSVTGAAQISRGIFPHLEVKFSGIAIVAWLVVERQSRRLRPRLVGQGLRMTKTNGQRPND